MIKNWDVDKVRKVLERKAVVRAVDVEPLASSSSYSISSLEVGMAAMNVRGPTQEGEREEMSMHRDFGGEHGNNDQQSIGICSEMPVQRQGTSSIMMAMHRGKKKYQGLLSLNDIPSLPLI